MATPSIDENMLTSNQPIAIIWQEVDEGVPEQAIQLRTYDNLDYTVLLELRQNNNTILINSETVTELCKLLKKYAQNKVNKK